MGDIHMEWSLFYEKYKNINIKCDWLVVYEVWESYGEREAICFVERMKKDEKKLGLVQSNLH